MSRKKPTTPVEMRDQHGDTYVVPPAAPVATPCPECPFNRKTTPGKLGGSSPEVYVGQAHGPFAIACHMHLDYDDPDWHRGDKFITTPQCAGAAIFRANLGIADRLPDAIGKLPASTEHVFGSCREFVEHHTQQPAPAANDPDYIEACLQIQIRKWKRGEKP